MALDSAAAAVRREFAESVRHANRVHPEARALWIERAWTSLRTLEKMAAEAPRRDVGDLSDARQQIVSAEADAKALGQFLSMPLADQCQSLGLKLERLDLDRTAKGWIVDQTVFKKPEEAALAAFRREGFVGTSCEGTAPLMLMKCGALDYLAKFNPFNDRNDACLRFFEAQCIILADRAKEIVAAIRSATPTEVEARLREITALPKYNILYPEMDAGALLELWNALTPIGVSRLAERIIVDPTLRAGWPDLVLVRGGEVRFVEVKTTDKLHNSQRTLIRAVLQPFGATVSVVQLRHRGVK